MAIGRMATWSIVVGLLVVAAPVAAQLRYVDKDGVAHWVQSPNQIPPEYREKAGQPTLPEIDAGKGEDAGGRARRKAFDATQQRERALEQAAQQQERARQQAGQEQESARQQAAQERRASEEALAAADAATSAKFRAAAEHCRKKVHNEVVVKPDDSYVMLGTKRQNFDFEKCMTKSGF